MDADAPLPDRTLVTLRILTPAVALFYLAAAVLHTGVKVPLGFVTLGFPEPVTAATIAESLIGGGLVAAALMLALAPARTYVAVIGIYVLALVFTMVGVIMGPQGLADRVVHAVMLAGVLVGLVLVLFARKSGSANSHGAMSGR